MSASPGITLDPDEWDFRSIPSEELKVALIYEYAREHLGVRGAVLDWLDSGLEREEL